MLVVLFTMFPLITLDHRATPADSLSRQNKGPMPSSIEPLRRFRDGPQAKHVPRGQRGLGRGAIAVSEVPHGTTSPAQCLLGKALVLACFLTRPPASMLTRPLLPLL